MDEATRELCRAFASILEYPDAPIVERAAACEEALRRVLPEAEAPLRRFRGFVAQTPLPEVEELYTRTFDLQPVCYPYVGYQLFGESYKRGAFLARLKERHQKFGFRDDWELPDHLSVMLRFLAELHAPEEIQVLIEEGMIPALEKMIQSFDGSENPYKDVLESLLPVLRQACVEAVSQRSALPGEQPLGREGLMR